MTEIRAPGASVRRHRSRWILGILLLIATACAVILPPWYRYRHGALKVIGVMSTAPGCGGTMYLDAKSVAVRSGTTVQFANRMDSMPIRFRVYRRGSAELLAESPWLSPGDTWTYAFWRPGSYTLSNNYADSGFLIGLQEPISVGLW